MVDRQGTAAGWRERNAPPESEADLDEVFGDLDAYRQAAREWVIGENIK